MMMCNQCKCIVFVFVFVLSFSFSLSLWTAVNLDFFLWLHCVLCVSSMLLWFGSFSAVIFWLLPIPMFMLLFPLDFSSFVRSKRSFGEFSGYHAQEDSQISKHFILPSMYNFPFSFSLKSAHIPDRHCCCFSCLHWLLLFVLFHVWCALSLYSCEFDIWVPNTS